MKTLLTITAFSLFAFASNAQINTQLRIYHRLGTQAFQMNNTAQNNLTQDFRVTRLQYYVTNFSVVHDGGTETAISVDTVALMNAGDGSFSTVALGSHSIINVEAVKFYIGVPQPANNADPSLYGPDHPLAPQSPSMHWGWASGYRFLAYEGQGGMNFSQTFQLHGLGNNNYFQTTVAATGAIVNGILVIALDADYTRGVENINVSNGVIAHGVDQEDLTALENFRDYVFSASSQDLTADVQDVNAISWAIYPNPSTSGEVNISYDAQTEIDGIRVTNAMGQGVNFLRTTGGLVTIQLSESGVYFVSIMNEGSTISTKRIIKQ